MTMAMAIAMAMVVAMAPSPSASCNVSRLRSCSVLSSPPALALAPAPAPALTPSSQAVVTRTTSSHCPAVVLHNSGTACIRSRQFPSCPIRDRELFSDAGSLRQLRSNSSSQPSSSRKVSSGADLRFEYGKSKAIPDDSFHKSMGARSNSLSVCHTGGFNTHETFSECADEVERMSTDNETLDGKGFRSSNFNDVSSMGSKELQAEGVRPKLRPAPGISLCSCGCMLGRRGLVGAALGGLLMSSERTNRVASASTLKSLDYNAVREAVHPARPMWYEELYAQSMAKTMTSYLAEMDDYKRRLFRGLDENVSRVLELGIGTGPNLKYYGNLPHLQSIIGVDPNLQMAKYCTDAVTDAGLSTSKFTFLHAVGERIPVEDESADAVVCTLTLCSVADVASTLEEVKRVLKPGGVFLFVEHVAAPDGSSLRFWQGLLDPLQQWVVDGCHLARNTLQYIEEAQFRSVQSERLNVKSASIMSPHIMGIAYK